MNPIHSYFFIPSIYSIAIVKWVQTPATSIIYTTLQYLIIVHSTNVRTNECNLV
jgi:hypothetical protein